MKMLQLPVLALGWPCDCQQQWRNHRWHNSEIYLISKRKKWQPQAFQGMYERAKREGSREEGCPKWGYHIKPYSTVPCYQPAFTCDTPRSSNRSSLISIAGSENPPNPSSPCSRGAGSVATPIREACLYVGRKFIVLSGQLTETRIRYCSISKLVSYRTGRTDHPRSF
jgi:hypothetical protein